MLYEGSYCIKGTIANVVMQNVLRSIEVPFGNQRIVNLSKWGHSQWCRRNLPHVYYSSRYGTEFDTDTAPDEDLRQAAIYWENDVEKAMFYLHSAAQKGSGRAAAKLGMCYLKGQSPLLINLELGKNYILQSVQSGNPQGQYILSQLYRQGIGGALSSNASMADWLLRLAADCGYPAAMKEIKNHPVSFEYISARQLQKLLKLDNRVKYLSENEEKRLRNWLWIPKADVICETEIREGKFANAEAIAICDSGIYLSRKNKQPQWIKWGRFMKGNLEARMHLELIELCLDGHLIWRSMKEGDEKSIVQKLIRISKANQR